MIKQPLLFIIITSLSVAQSDSASYQLADVERAFSFMCEKEGIKNSFLKYFDDDCLMFNPHPVNGKQLYQHGPASSQFLSWYPVFVETAACGDFGISTGPWEIRKSRNDTVSARGYYFSVWEKRNGKEWKVTFDQGVTYPKEKHRTEPENIRLLKSPGKNFVSPQILSRELINEEHRFSHSVKKIGFREAFKNNAADNVRVYRDGDFPSTNNHESDVLIGSDNLQAEIFPLKAHVASSGDLGFVYGYAVSAQNDSSSYLRVWRKEEGWKIAVDLLKPFKPRQ